MSGIQIADASALALRLSGALTAKFTCPLCGLPQVAVLPAPDLTVWPGINLTCRTCEASDFEVYLELSVTGHRRQVISFSTLSGIR
jgi:hypothetical protein